MTRGGPPWRQAGKNAWRQGQAFFIAVYFAGTITMFNAARRALDAIPAAA